MVGDVGRVESRWSRRAAELDGPAVDVAVTQRDMARRDHLDSTRPTSPTMRAADAVVIDTTTMSLDEVIEKVVALAQPAKAQGGGSR
jgi:cytidylate kinase